MVFKLRNTAGLDIGTRGSCDDDVSVRRLCSGLGHFLQRSFRFRNGSIDGQCRAWKFRSLESNHSRASFIACSTNSTNSVWVWRAGYLSSGAGVAEFLERQRNRFLQRAFLPIDHSLTLESFQINGSGENWELYSSFFSHRNRRQSLLASMRLKSAYHKRTCPRRALCI